MPKFDQGRRYVSIFPDGENLLLKLGEKGKEPVFYVDFDGNTPLGAVGGTTFASLKDTPNDLDKNVGKVLGSIGKKVGYINNAIFDNLEVKEEMEIKNLSICGTLESDTIKNQNSITTKALKVQDITTTKLKSDHIECDGLLTKSIAVDTLISDSVRSKIIDCDTIKVKDLITEKKVFGSFAVPLMISKAEINNFLVDCRELVIFATWPYNQDCLEFTVKTEELLSDKFVSVDVMDLYGDTDVILTGKLVKIVEPNLFKVKLCLGKHTGNSIVKIMVRIN